jgi:SulP family sulfate permease
MKPGAAGGRVARWRLRADGLVGDLRGGFTAAIVMVAIEGSYGLVAFAPLGPAYQPAAFLAGVHAAVLACIVPVLAGARGPMLKGPTSALALLIAALLISLGHDPRFVLPDGRPHAALLLAFISIGVVLAGAIQIAIAALRVGRVIRYVPYPVHAGVMNGVAVLMVLAMLPHALGIPGGGEDWRQAHPWSVPVALAAAWTAIRPPRWTRALPSYLTALLAATALHHALRIALADDGLGPSLGAIELRALDLNVLAPLAGPAALDLLRDKAAVLVQFSLAVALIASLQTLLIGNVVDMLTRERRDAERELLGEGLANIAAGCIGALPSCAGIARSKPSLDAGATGSLSRVAFGAGLLLALALGWQLLQHVPMAAIAGVFVAIAFSLVDPWSRRASRLVLQGLVRAKPPARSLSQSYAVMLLVAGTTVFVSLPHGVAIGVLAAMAMFIRSNSRQPIRAVSHADHRSSRKVRGASAAELLHAHGRRIAVLELDGALFFGTADVAACEIENLSRLSDQIIVDFRRVSEVDASGARVLVQAADAARRCGKRLLLASLPLRDVRRRWIREIDLHDTLSEEDFFVDLDLALESAEDRLLASIDTEPEENAELQLHDTMLGAGLGRDEIDRLAAVVVRRTFARSEHVFRRGEQSDAMLVSVRGRIGIWLNPADAAEGQGQRLVCFAPGVVFGEMGLLERRPRSADAIAEDDAVVLELPGSAFDRLAAEHPVLLGKLLLNLSLHLSNRVRAPTDELEAADEKPSGPPSSAAGA